MSAPFDVVVFGATGFTGALIAKHLITEPESALGSTTAVKWALAGRSETKLEALKRQLKQQLPQVNSELIEAIPVVTADSHDEASLLALAKQTKVVLSLVGPYTLYGELLVKVCAENGVHYCDLTGEMLWVREMIRKYQRSAVASGAVLVNSCGVDSVPSDLIAYLLATQIHKRRGDDVGTGRVDFLITETGGGVSGGTFASVMQIVEGKTSDQLSQTCNPFVLTDEHTIKQKQLDGLVHANSPTFRITFDKTLGQWTSLFLGQFMNQAVVHRSNYLLDNLYGPRFVYGERFAIGGFLSQLLVTSGSFIVTAMMYFSWTRKLFKKLGPAPGEGPSEQQLRDGCFVIDANGYTEDGELAAQLKAVSRGDPGYILTSRLITESAFCLAKGELRHAVHGGFYTTAAAFGHTLSDRLHAKKFMTFDFKDLKQETPAKAAAF